MCEQASETIEHFLSCPKYGPALETDWRQIDENNAEKQVEIGTFIKNRHIQRKKVLTQQEVGQPSNSNSIAPDMQSFKDIYDDDIFYVISNFNGQISHKI